MDKTNVSPLVSVIMLSYNQADCMERAIASVLQQETDFKFEIVVHDDASTDGSQDILKRLAGEHPDKFKLILRQENYFRKEGGFGLIMQSLMAEADGKYLANLECDDVWTDNRKLQEQVDMLEAHPEASVCTGAYVERLICNDTSPAEHPARKIVYSKDGNLLPEGAHIEPYYFFTEKEWAHRWLTKNLTAVYRKDALQDHIRDIQKYQYLRDVHIFYYLLQKGCGIYMTKVLGEYDICDSGIFGSKSRQNQRRQHLLCYRELWKVLRHPLLLRLLIEKRLSLMFHGLFDGQLAIPG